jgi:hypothetical protein
MMVVGRTTDQGEHGNESEGIPLNALHQTHPLKYGWNAHKTLAGYGKTIPAQWKFNGHLLSVPFRGG